MIDKIKAACGFCKVSFEVNYHLQIDAVAFPELKQSLLARRLNQCKCPRCGQSWSLIAPCVYWNEDLVSVVLATLAERPLSVREAIAETNNLLKRTKPDRAYLPSRTLVMGTVDELIYMLENPGCAAYTKPLFDMLLRNWSVAIHGLTALSDAFLAADMPEFAFWVFGDTLPYIPELYFERGIREALEITALAAGDKLLPGQKTAKTASEQLKLISQFATDLEPRILGDTGQFEHFELLYYTPHKVGTRDLLTSNMIIYQPEVSNVEKALARIFVMLWAAEATRYLPAENAEVAFFGQDASVQLALHWPSLSGEEQLGLNKLYKSLTGGSLSSIMG